ncbi:hypothetical protein FGD71_008535 [Streptomyces sporangiiformans]|uniref:Uncharacterized protein n=1 Tax=Streptomyces sporangiiformans TaxID=2315329 RepID=A0A505DDI9_9ACTN|nr:hypothetical protein FGD71_008535 [Streptomyces sporangiiformans]
MRVRADLVPDDLWERVAPLLPPVPSLSVRAHLPPDASSAAVGESPSARRAPERQPPTRWPTWRRCSRSSPTHDVGSVLRLVGPRASVGCGTVGAGPVASPVATVPFQGAMAAFA